LLDLFRSEDHAFPRDLLATDAGRDARSAFNALGRTIRALEEFKLPSGHLPSGPELIVGERLSAVSFVLGYIQLAFDGPSFTVLSPIQVQTPNSTARAGENGFRDGLCEAIGHRSCPFAWCKSRCSNTISGRVQPDRQGAVAANLTMALSLKGAMVSSVI
jgi:hypothetical protein